MPYSQGTKLPGESASKLGHLAVVQSEWVRSLIEDFENSKFLDGDPSKTVWQEFNPACASPLRNIWAVDGSFVTVSSEQKPPKEVSFVKAALLMLDRAKLDSIDKDLPHPLLLRDVLKDSGIQHSTVFPLRNVRTSLGTNYQAVRNIIRDSFKIDQDGAFHETLKWLAYRKWEDQPSARSPGFECPHCHVKIDEGLGFDLDEDKCPNPDCNEMVYLSDCWGFHLEMDDDSAPESVASSYMLVMEHLMLFTAVRLMWNHSDKSLVSDTLFIKDGPLTLRSQYSKFVPNIRSLLQFSKDSGRPIHIIGQEKSGAFFDHLSSISRFASPHERGQSPAYSVLSHSFVRREVYRSPDLSNPYGYRTNWGEKLYVKLDPGASLVINAPTGNYIDEENRPVSEDIIGLARILSTLPSITSHKFEGALYPIELANGIASMSSYPSATILKRFLDGASK